MENNTCLEKQPLCEEMLEKMNAYWRAANYLSAGQLYLLDNPLLKKPLSMDQIKKKIVGHWGTVPGQNFVYIHCNRAIKRYDLDIPVAVRIFPSTRNTYGSCTSEITYSFPLSWPARLLANIPFTIGFINPPPYAKVSEFPVLPP